MDSQNNSQTPLLNREERTAPQVDTGAEQAEQPITAEPDAGAISSAQPGEMEQTEEKRPGFLRRFFGGIGHWLAHHKVLVLILAVLIAAGVFFLRKYLAGKTPTGPSYSFVRTTTLQRTTLQDSVSTTGTVASADVSNVTTTLTYAVSSVNVQVGDVVAAGDVIATLDSSELEQQITRKNESIVKQQEQLEQSNKKLYQSYTDAQEDLQKAKDDRASVQADYDKAKEEYDDANDEYEDARDDYHDAKDRIDSFIEIANETEAAMKNALANYNDVRNRRINEFQSEYEQAGNQLSDAEDRLSRAQEAYNEDPSDENKNELDAAQQKRDEAKTAYDKAQWNYNNIAQVAEELDKQDGVADAKAAYDDAVKKNDEAQEALQNAQNSADFNTLEQKYDAAISTRDQKESALESQQKTVDSADEKITSAEKSVTRAYEAYQEGSTNSSLDDLQDDLADLKQKQQDCTLVAETSGTVTALNATVGSSCQGTVATIQDTNNLKINITLEEYDVSNVSKGMTALITSDATTGNISGTVTQVDPTSTSGATTGTTSGTGSTSAGSSSSGGTFGAEVSVLGGSNGLLIGMNASVEIIKDSTDNVFVVPLDAVGMDSNGQFVYLKTGGTGADATFEKAAVTTGNSNDYYIEVSGSGLNEGDEVRATADLTQGLETTTDPAVIAELSGQSMDAGTADSGDAAAAEDTSANNGGGRGNRGGPMGGGPGGM